MAKLTTRRPGKVRLVMRLPQHGRAFAPDAVARERHRSSWASTTSTPPLDFSRLRSANERINRALTPYPEDLVIATKVGPHRDRSGQWLPLATPEQLPGRVEQNLRKLGRDHLDLVNLRVSGLGSIADHLGLWPSYVTPA
jgi:pyridoxine 4-dehydrogenase